MQRLPARLLTGELTTTAADRPLQPIQHGQLQQVQPAGVRGRAEIAVIVH